MSRDSALPTGLAHVSLAVADAESVAKQYENILGAIVRSREKLEDRGIHVVFLDVAGVSIELVEPIDPDDEGNTVARFLKRRGQGVHHLAFLVPDAGAALDRAKERGADLVDDSPRSGAEGCRVGFLHPRSTAGALIEFVEEPETVEGED